MANNAHAFCKQCEETYFLFGCEDKGFNYLQTCFHSIDFSAGRRLV